jgi:hypothetical protein
MHGYENSPRDYDHYQCCDLVRELE